MVYRHAVRKRNFPAGVRDTWERGGGGGYRGRGLSPIIKDARFRCAGYLPAGRAKRIGLRLRDVAVGTTDA